MVPTLAERLCYKQTHYTGWSKNNTLNGTRRKMTRNVFGDRQASLRSVERDWSRGSSLFVSREFTLELPVVLPVVPGNDVEVEA